jgi:D-glycero-beta-D-manno-heptose 1-phosphate adenylyltransferase
MSQKIEIIRRKILAGPELDRWLAQVRFKNRKIVFTNGCFDVLHRGHVDYLAQASELSDLLVIGLNTDESVKRLKGPSRPYQDEETRAYILASMSFTAAIILFEEDTPLDLIRKVRPDVLVKGSDYKTDEIVGHDLVASWGGKVTTIDLTPGFSSTKVIGKLTDKR